MVGDVMLIAGAFVLELCFGYPRWLQSSFGHPVVWIGKLLTSFEKYGNRASWPGSVRRVIGTLGMLFLLLACGIAGAFVEAEGWWYALPLMASLFATRSLYEHVRDVLRPMETGDEAEARIMLARIVGRDVASLDAAGICRAAIESLAESISDAVVAPLFWACVGGLPGLLCYKMLNTADSMIGHKEAHYREFGWAAARLDDLANLVPARISAAMIALVAGSWRAWQTAWGDASRHASPNAGWPEAAMAGALGLQLGGTLFYDGIEHAGAVFGTGRFEATRHDLYHALGLYRRLIAALLCAHLILLAII